MTIKRRIEQLFCDEIGAYFFTTTYEEKRGFFDYYD